MPDTLVDLSRYVSPERVVIVGKDAGKRGVLARLIEVTAAHPLVTDKPAFTKAIFDREDVTSTGIGGGIAVPHARLASIAGFVITIGLCPMGVEFAAQDRQPVYVMVMVAATDQDRKGYLLVLASVASRLRVPRLVPDIIAAKDDPQRVVDLFLGR